MYSMLTPDIIAYYDSPVSKQYRYYSYFSERQNTVISLLDRLIGDSVLDIGAGDAFWPSHLNHRLTQYVGVDVGKENCLLAVQLMNNNADRVTLMNADIFSCDLSMVSVETVFLGFFCSHFDFSSLTALFRRIKETVQFKNIIILDSFWSPYREAKFTNNHMRLQERIMEGSPESVFIPKRYVSKKDIDCLSHCLRFKANWAYQDDYWCLIELH